MPPVVDASEPVTDVMMPGLRGPELAERLIALRPGLRVLYISGFAAEAMGDHILLEGGANYLEKPFTPEALARAARRRPSRWTTSPPDLC